MVYSCRPPTPRVTTKKLGKAHRSDAPATSRPIRYLPKELAAFATLLTALLLIFYAFHCIWVSAEMYSAPSIVLQTRNPDGSKRTLDDFREAYAWLRCVATRHIRACLKCFASVAARCGRSYQTLCRLQLIAS